MKMPDAGWTAFLLLAVAVALIVVLLRELGAAQGGGGGPWVEPRVLTATVVPTVAAHGWWEAISSPPNWPTPRATNTPGGTPQED